MSCFYQLWAGFDDDVVCNASSCQDELLVLLRRPGESILIGDEMIIKVVRNTLHTVDLSITAPPGVHRLLLPEDTALPADQEVISRRVNESLQLGADTQIVVVNIR